jgi:hypothetical protein
VFGVAFALLMIDFAMRLAVIEKRVAAGYRSNDASSHDEAEDQDSHGTVGADEVSPLLNRHSMLLSNSNNLYIIITLSERILGVLMFI